MVVYRQESVFFLVPGCEDVGCDGEQGEKPAHAHIGQRDMSAGGTDTPTGIAMVQAMAIVKRIDVGSKEALRGVDLMPPLERIVSDAVFGRRYPHLQIGFRERSRLSFDFGD